jgi:hypothetical protein
MSRSNGHKPYVPPAPETLRYEGDGLDVTLSIARANGSIGTYRTLLLQRAKEEEATAPDMADLLALGNYLTHLFVYPSLIAATVAANGLPSWPLSFAEYMELPEQFLIAWEAKVWELNPHWRPKEPEPEAQDEEDQKKVPSSAQGS